MLRFACAMLACLLSIQMATATEITVVVLRDGKPVPDAIVGTHQPDHHPDPAKPKNTTKPKPVNADGKITLDIDLKEQMTIYATAPGWIGFRGVGPIKEETSTTQPNAIIMMKATEHTARFLDSDGKPLAGVEVKAAFLCDKMREPGMISDSKTLSLPAELGQKTTTDAEGRFKLTSIPEGYIVCIVFQSKTHGHGTITRASTNKSDIVLKEAGKVRFVFDPPESEPREGESSIFISTVLKEDPRFKLETIATTNLNNSPKEGNALSGLVPGTYNCRLSSKAGSAWLFDQAPGTILVEAGKTTDVRIKGTRGVILTGRIVDAETGEGLAGINVSGRSHAAIESMFATTDKDGRFRFSVKSNGTYGFSCSGMLKSGGKFYLQPKYSPEAQSVVAPLKVDGAGPASFETLKLVEARTIRGKVVDATGQAWKGAIEIECPTETVMFSRNNDHISFDGAKFTIRGLPFDTPITLRARSGDAVNIPTRINTDELNKDITLTLDRKNAVQGKGIIQDSDKVGLAGVKVSAHWSFPILGSNGLSTSKVMATAITNEKGEYTFTGLWPNERYFVGADDPRFGKLGYDFNSHSQAGPGETITYPPLEAKILKNTMSGSVVHLDGSPAVGVRVFTCGETPKEISTTTDATGKFKLEQMPSGKLFLLASHTGYRPTYLAWDTQNKTAVKLTMRKLTDPAAPSPAPTPEFLAARKKALIQVIDLCWAKTDEIGGYRYNLFDDLIRLDREEAKRKAATAKEAIAPRLKAALSKNQPDETLAQLGLEDPESVIELITTNDRYAYTRLVSIGEIILKDDKPKALLFAEAAVRAARKTDPGRRFWLVTGLAKAAALAHRAGNPTGAEKLMAEAFELVSTFSEKEFKDQALSEIIFELGKYDLNATFDKCSLIQGVNYFNTTLSKSLARLAETDPKTALARLKELRTASNISDGVSPARVFLVTIVKEPELTLAAVTALRSMEHRVQAYMEMAITLKKLDPAKAHSFIDKAFEELSNEPSYSYRGNANMAAQVALVGHEVGYPDLHTLVAKSLAMRKKPDTESFNDDSKVNLALLLAGIDPATARWLIRIGQSEEELQKSTSRRNRNLTYALAMCDPDMFVKYAIFALTNVLDEAKFSGTSLVETLNCMSQSGAELKAFSTYSSIYFRPIER